MMGLLWLLSLNGGLALSAYLVARFGLKQERGTPRVLASAVVGWSWLTVGMQALGTLGRLTREGLAAWVVIGLIAGFGCKALRPDADVQEKVPREARTWAEAIAVGLVLWASAVMGGISFLGPVKVVSDGPIYHLYFAARWWKSARLNLIAAPFGETAATYFPANGDLWFTWLMAAWGGDLFAKVGQAPFLALTGLTTYALARRLGAGREASTVASCWFASTSIMLTYAFEPNVDQIFVAGYLLASYFFLRFELGDEPPSGLVLGGLAAGLALGTKAPAIVFVPPLIGLGMAAAWRKAGSASGSRLRPRRFAAMLTVAFSAFATSGFWFARNGLMTGNPFYPLHVEAFGKVWLRGWYVREVMWFSQYFIPIGSWRSLVDITLGLLDPRLAPFWFAALLGVWKWGNLGSRPENRLVWLASGLAVANVALFWVLIPYRTQQRFMLHAIGLAVVPLARMLDRSRRHTILAVALLAVHVLTPQTWPISRGSPPWDFDKVVVNAIPALIPIPSTPPEWAKVFASNANLRGLALFFVVGLLSIATARVWFSYACRPSSGMKARARAVLVTAAFLGVEILGAYPHGLDDRRRFFPAFEYYRGWMALDTRCGPDGARVAYSGTDLPYYLMGVRLRNEVRYVNIDAHRDWLMHDYHREALRAGDSPSTWPTPRPGWDRIHPDYDAWLANLRAERIQLLVVTRANPDEGLHNLADPERFPIERVWADAHPEVFELVHGDRDPLFRLYRVRPPGDRPRPDISPRLTMGRGAVTAAPGT